MKLDRRYIIRLSVILSIITWLALLAANLLLLFYQQHNVPPEIPLFLPDLLLVALILIIYLFFQYNIYSSESFNILDLLWKVFVTGLIATVVSLSTKTFTILVANNHLANNPYVNLIIYQINFGLFLIFLNATFIAWKRLILYQKSKKLLMTWSIFQYTILASLFLNLSELERFDLVYTIMLSLLVILSVFLSVNLKWVPYLNFKQKWKSILLNILITLYLFYFLKYLTSTSNLINIENAVQYISTNVTIFAIIIFVCIYAVFSILVILFNLPTSSVFEQKLEEVINFQRLSQSGNTSQDEDQIYQILLESSVSAVIANAAWLEINEYRSSGAKILYHKINDKRKYEIERSLDEEKMKKIYGTDPFKYKKTSRFTSNLSDPEFKSILIFPIYIQENMIGMLALLKDLREGFNREMIEIIRTFVSQASISIENFRLVEEAIENERYKEELKIAKRVQGSLLPTTLDRNGDFEISAYSRSAAEVGGDYYDTFRISEFRVAIIIGDVSGKGTSAAFHMSQMKGVFQSLVQLDLPPGEFIIKANNALSNCLDRTSFITTSYFVIDQLKKEIEFTRAGHCPTLLYQKKTDEVLFLEDSGLGLGILRDEQFDLFVEVNHTPYLCGDILFLYTDGITEAKNQYNEEFGFDRLKTYLFENREKSASEIKNEILKALLDFCETKPPDDDLTLLIIKFK